jgi:hypothetical protein
MNEGHDQIAIKYNHMCQSEMTFNKQRAFDPHLRLFLFSLN